MRRLAPFGWLLAVTGCVGLNPRFDESQTDGSSAGGGGTSSTPESSTSAASTVSGTGSSATAAATSTGIGTTDDTVGTPHAVVFTDDAWDGEFAAAEDLGSVGWNENSIQLLGTSNEGVLESRIFDAGNPTQWNELRWAPRAPYETHLQFPIDEEALAYPTGNTSVDALQFLAHLEGGPFLHDAPVEDATGLHPARWIGAPDDDASAEIRGVFGRGLSHDDNNNTAAYRIELDEAVEPGTGPFTWTVWYRSKSCSNMYMMALDSRVVDPDNAGLHFLACGGGPAFGCRDAASSHAIGFIQGAGQTVATRVCSATVIDDGRWHHIALRRTVAGTGQDLQIFVDGALSGTLPSLTTSITDVSVHPGIEEPEEFTLAGGNEASYSGAGAYDEFALWNRALQPAEIANLYRRGARVARFQVRACEEPDCSDRDFTGPGGADISAGYVDPGLQAGHTIDLSGLELNGRYIQYRFLLGRPNAMPSPAIEAVTISGIRQ